MIGDKSIGLELLQQYFKFEGGLARSMCRACSKLSNDFTTRMCGTEDFGGLTSEVIEPPSTLVVGSSVTIQGLKSLSSKQYNSCTAAITECMPSNRFKVCLRARLPVCIQTNTNREKEGVTGINIPGRSCCTTSSIKEKRRSSLSKKQT
jgi:hypothetical protein